jgi:diguanylate cyclase (GGDEF)-like protein
MNTLSVSFSELDLLREALGFLYQQNEFVGGNLRNRSLVSVPAPERFRILAEALNCLLRVVDAYREQAIKDPQHGDPLYREVRNISIEMNLELPLLRAAMAALRRSRAESAFQSAEQFVDPGYRDEIEAVLLPLDALLSVPPLDQEPPAAIPRAFPLLASSSVDAILGARTITPRQFDPKHQTLLAQDLVIEDLKRVREQCDWRGLPMAVVFADLDGFKAANEQAGEHFVDRQVLPQILATVRDHIFGHGDAYRQGGDEFVFLLPNREARAVREIVEEIRRALALLEFPRLTWRARLSAGAWISVPGSHLAAQELIERANAAKRAAKHRPGKNTTVIRHEWGSGFTEVEEAQL